MNYCQFEKSPTDLLISTKRKRKQSNKNDIIELSKDFKNLLLVVNRLNRKVNELEKKVNITKLKNID